MKRFKLTQGLAKPYEITRQNFEQLTGGEAPYVEKGKDGETRAFGICPACDNPIQLIGLYRPLPNTDHPYGRHYNRDAEIAKHNEQAYQYCPYAKHAYERSKKKEKVTNFEKSIYDTLRDNFDYAIYLLSQISGLKVNQTFAADLLDSYLSSRGYLYAEATLYNLPWMLLACYHAKPCFGKVIRKGSPLYLLLQKRKEVNLVPIGESPYVQVKGKDSWLDLDFTTILHQRTVVDDEVKETMSLALFTTDSKGLPKMVDKTLLEINEYRFPNLIASDQAKQYRNEELLEMAKRQMPELHCTAE